MKKNRTTKFKGLNCLKKLCLSICLISFATNFITASPLAYAEQTKLTVKMTNRPVKEVIEFIEKNSEFIFIYQADKVNLDKRVSVNLTNQPVNKILDQALNNTNLAYTIKDRQVIISKKEAAASTTVSAQQPTQRHTVSGTVLDHSGSPLLGATVFVKGTTTGTTTDINGKYSVAVDGNSTLVFSHISYEAKEEPVGTRTTINVTMQEKHGILDEVVVVGFATQKKVNLTGAVSSVKMDDVTGVRPMSSTGALLQGVIPGLQITSGSGEPGAGVNMNIRGVYTTSTITSTNPNGGSPLILVDNVPLNGPLSLVNPDDIETISVLKDGGSAAIYGARGAFGVVLITTKGAKKNEQLKVSYTANFAFSRPTQLPVKASPLNTVKAFKDAEHLNHRGRDIDKWIGYLEDYAKNPRNEDYVNGYIEDGGVRYPLKQYDHIGDYLSETGFQQVHTASVSGSSERSSYRISLGYTDSDGVMVTHKDYYNKISVRGFLSTKITKWLSGEIDMNYAKSNKGMPNKAAYQLAVRLPSYTPNGKTIASDGSEQYIGTPDNLAKLSGMNRTGYSNTRIGGKLIATPLKGLTVNAELTYENVNLAITEFAKRFTYAEPYDYALDYSESQAQKYNAKQVTNNTTLNLFASYNRTIGDGHNFTLLGGYNMEMYHMDNLTGTAKDMISDEVGAINLATGEVTAREGISEYNIMGFFGRLNYDYKERYLFEFNCRYDGSSKFKKGHRWGFYPSFGASWRISQEPFMINARQFMPELKLRFSYANLGNQGIAPYQFLSTMSAYNLNLKYNQGGFFSWIHDGAKPQSLMAPGLESGNFTWEKFETLNLGIIASLFRGRLNIEVDLFQRTTKDMLEPGEQLPGVVGASAPMRNVASLRSRGYEIDVQWKDRIGKVGYYIGFNLYDYQSKITKYNSNAVSKRIYKSDGTNNYYKGYNMGTIWGYQTERFYTADDFDANGKLLPHIPRPAGVSPNPGDILFANYDEAKDGAGYYIINNGSGTLEDRGDLKIIGNSSLRYQYGIRGGVNWNNIDFSFFMEGVGKRDLYLNNELVFPMYYEHGGIFSHQLNYWTPDRPNAKFPRIYKKGYGQNDNFNSNTRIQTKYLQNGAYIRVKNITLGYTIPREITKKWGINNFRVFSSIENPFMFDHLPKGLDPTLSNYGGGLGYPVMRIISFGVSLDL